MSVVSFALAVVFIIILAKLFNKSMECGEYPDCLKISQIVPIPKCSSPSIPSHYRPISILSTVSKIFEKIVYARVSNFLNKNKTSYKLAIRV